MTVLVAYAASLTRNLLFMEGLQTMMSSFLGFCHVPDICFIMEGLQTMMSLYVRVQILGAWQSGGP